MKFPAKLTTVVAASVLLIACGGDENVRNGGDGYGDGSGGYGSNTGTGTLDGQNGVNGNAFGDGVIGSGSDQNLLDRRTIYFDFDRSDVDSQYRAIVEAHARYLAANPGKRILLEGHADERGSREYNIALGQRRADAVERIMTFSGASASQIRTLSYGEEKPVSYSHDEQSWSLNRRVEIVYE